MKLAWIKDLQRLSIAVNVTLTTQYNNTIQPSAG